MEEPALKRPRPDDAAPTTEAVRVAVKKRDGVAACAALDAFAAFAEGNRASRTALTSSLVSSVLHLASTQPAAVEQGLALCTRLHTVTGLKVDERAATMRLRLEAAAGRSNADLRASLSELLVALGGTDGELPKRRLFVPLLTRCCDTGDGPGAVELLRKGVDVGGSSDFFHEGDYELILTAITKGPAQEAVPCATAVLEALQNARPLIGGKTAALLLRLLPGAQEASVAATGTCSRCTSKLDAFDFSPALRDELLDSITNHLAKAQCVQKTSSTEEAAKAMSRFEALKAFVASNPADVVIDGANIGYYGLSAWYETAKRSVLAANGRDPTTVSPSELTIATLKRERRPPDVPPNFQVIDAAVESVIARFATKPLVFLHERHFGHGMLHADNAAVLRKWEQRGVPVCRTPSVVNDDVCWLYGAVFNARARGSGYLLSNDQMRDHHFNMLTPRPFLRWRLHHQIKFYGKMGGGAMSVILLEPAAFSTWIQRHGASWHIPFVRRTIDHDTGRLDVPDEESTLVVTQSTAGQINSAAALCDAWICTNAVAP